MDNVKKSFLIIALVIGIIAITVAFATLSTRLSISGTASVPDVSWNIHFQNWTPDTQNKVTVGTNEQDNTAEYPSVSQLEQSLTPNVTLVEGLNVTLKQPGDYAKYKFQIINEGTIDAELNSFSAPMTCTSGSGCDDVINYEVKCYYNEDFTGSELTTHSVLEKTNGTAYCYLKVEYKDTTNQNSGSAGSMQTYEQSAIASSLSASWQWIQKTENGQSGSNSGNEQGNNEPEAPSNPYATTFNSNYIGYYWIDVSNNGYNVSGTYHGNSSGWYTSLNPESLAYLRTDGTTPEICGVFGSGQSGTVCMTGALYNSNYSSSESYSSDFKEVSSYGSYTLSNIATSGLKGYSLAKAEEMLSKGAQNCEVDENGVYCKGAGTYQYCNIYDIGGIDCSIENGTYIHIWYDGTAY